LLPKKFFADVHPKFRTPWKNTILVGLLAAMVGSTTPIDDSAGMVNIGTLLAFVIVSIAVLVLRRTNRVSRAPSGQRGSAGANSGRDLQRLHDVQARWVNWARLIIWLFIGLVVYFAYGRFHSRVQKVLAASEARALHGRLNSHAG